VQHHFFAKSEANQNWPKKKFFFFCLWGRRLMLFAQSNISNLSYVLLSPKTRTMIFG
jgi:hypothetical protein